MQRIVILIDGTWNEKDKGRDTNVAKLAVAVPLIRDVAADGTAQIVRYHKGVGTGGDRLQQFLGGTIGLGLRQIVLDAYRSVVETYAPGDDLILCGFSRGAYAARALAGMIGASGIQKTHDLAEAHAAWDHYRTTPRKRPTVSPLADPHPDRRIKCVAVWDTVGSYGVPAGIGFTALARYVALIILGFHDTSFGKHIGVGLHALAVDERRRPFVPTFWTAPKDKPPRGHVEQTWFAGAHSNVGGGSTTAGLSDEALLWMIARLEALTGLAFDHEAVWAATKAESIDGEVDDSTIGWPIDHRWPHLRAILAPDAVEHGYFANTPNASLMNINERVHWTVMQKRGRPCTVFGRPHTPYAPATLPAGIHPDQIAAATPEEAVLFKLSEPSGDPPTA